LLYEKFNYVYCNGIPEFDSRLYELYRLKNDALEAIIFDYNLQPVAKTFNDGIELELYSFCGFSFYSGQDVVMYETEPEIVVEGQKPSTTKTIKTGIKQRVLQISPNKLDVIPHVKEVAIPFETALDVIKTYLRRDDAVTRACDVPTD
jgi:hypothetical protein